MPDPRPTRTKATGQWALGQREPLNANEKFKAEDNGLNVRERVEQIYAREGFGSIAPEGPAGPSALVGPHTPSASPASTAAALPACLPKNSTTSTSCCASAPMAEC